MKLTKPLCFLDIESATPGPNPDPARDKMVTLAFHIVQVDYSVQSKCWFFNPGFPMTDSNIECHGITNAVAAGYPMLTKAHAEDIVQAMFASDLAGFNLLNYDVPLLWEELYRVGVALDLNGVHIIDVGNIFKLKEERSLSAAVRFYCSRDHKGAHDAGNDCEETASVFMSQLARYPDLGAMDVAGIAKFSHFDERLDLAGKIIKGPDGDAVYNFGAKTKGVKVIDDPGFGNWMLSKDFSENTKRVVRKLLGYESEERGLFDDPQKQ